MNSDIPTPCCNSTFNVQVFADKTMHDEKLPVFGKCSNCEEDWEAIFIQDSDDSEFTHGQQLSEVRGNALVLSDTVEEDVVVVYSFGWFKFEEKAVGLLGQNQ